MKGCIYFSILQLPMLQLLRFIMLAKIACSMQAENLDKIRHLEEQITCDRTDQQHQYSQENDTEKAEKRP